MSNGPIEPSADFRRLAAVYRQIFIALMQEGFSTQEALVIIGQIMVAAFGRGSAA